MDKGIRDADDLMIEPAPKTFRSLKIEYGLTNDYYTYLHITHFMCSNPNTTLSLPWHIAQYYTNPNSKTKGISLFYKKLNNKDIFHLQTSNILA